MMAIGQLLISAQRLAHSAFPVLRQDWVDLSMRLGSRLPGSLLPVAIQRSGNLDILLRALEAETAKLSPTELADMEIADRVSMQMHLSELWIGAAYEICRICRSTHQGDPLARVAHLLRLLRVPMEKMQIAGDWSLKEPLEMYSTGQDDEPVFRGYYDKDDPLKAHIMPSGLSRRGSCTWQAIELPAKKSVWIERQGLSDAFLNAAKVLAPPAGRQKETT